ncbi:hypothetical protein ABBQ32_012491 [Trebouxia sp. C0010 RCD-2024]
MHATYSSAVLRQAVVQQACLHAHSLHASLLCLGFAASAPHRRIVSHSSCTVQTTQRLQISRKIATGAHGSAEALDSPDGEQQASQFLPAILLAYFASQNRSLLAAECLIETVIEMYRRGTQLDSLQFTLSMETLQSGSTLLSEQELDILTARCGIIMLTLHEIGCETYAEAQEKSDGTAAQQPLSSKAEQLTRGLGKFVSQIINMYKSGFNSRRMLLQQSLAKGVEAGGQGALPPSVITMQQNTRLVVLTLEMIQQSHIPTQVPLESIAPQENHPADEESPSSSSPAVVPPSMSSSSDPPMAAARKTQIGQPHEQRQNSSSSEDSLPQQRGRTARAEPARVEQQQEQSIMPSGTQEEEQQASAQSHMGQSEMVGQQSNVKASNPEETSANPVSTYTSPDQILSPTGYILGFVHAIPAHNMSHPSSSSPSSIPTQSPGSEPQSSERSSAELPSESSLPNQEEGGARSAAVQLLLGFMGALQASQYAVESFVSTAVCHYRHGWSAQQLFNELQQEEFAQTGGLLPTDPRIQAATDTPAHLTAELFARWLSTAFMTLAVMGVPHPQAPQTAGWAWVTLPDSSSSPGNSAVQAHRLAEVVANKLRLEEDGQDDDGMTKQLSESARAMRESSVFQQMASQRNRAPQEDQYVVLEDPDLPLTSTGYSVLVQQLELITMTSKFMKQQLQIENESG